ncbi:MAG: HAD family hydrolase, partial [Candidatus Cybelea sp.]
MKTLIVFDLDGTLAQSKAAIDEEMGTLFATLLRIPHVRVSIISGGDWPQFETQVLGHLPPGADLSKLSLLPTNGTRFYRYTGSWSQLYAENLSDAQKAKIIDALNKEVAASGFAATKTWGPTI